MTKAVTGGGIAFRPVSDKPGTKPILGRPASGEVQPDGTYVLGTHAKSDGAVVGKHEIRFTPPAVKVDHELQPDESPPPSPYDGLVPKTRQIEVKPGKNEINIELVKGT